MRIDEALASIQEALKDTEYPAEKRDIVEHAKHHNVGKEVIDDIKSLPDKVYTSVEDVNREFEGKQSNKEFEGK